MSATPIALKQVGPDREFYLAEDQGKHPYPRYRRQQCLLKASPDPVHNVRAPAGFVLAINEADRTLYLFPEETLVYD